MKPRAAEAGKVEPVSGVSSVVSSIYAVESLEHGAQQGFPAALPLRRDQNILE